MTLPQGWVTKELGELATVGAGNSAPQDDALFAEGAIPFFRTSDVGRIRFGDIDTSATCLNDQGALGLRRFPKGTILFPKSGASTFLNHRVMMQSEGCVSSHLSTIVAKPDQAEPRFLLYFLATVQAQDLVQDHAYPSLNLPLIAGIKVPVPPLPEQRRIVSILDEAFEAIATAKANTERNLENAREVFDSFHASMVERAARDWHSAKLGELAQFRNGINYTKRSTGKTVSIVGVKDFKEHLWAPLNDLDKATVDGDLGTYDRLAEGDILCVRSNGNPTLIGRSMIIGQLSVPTAHSGFTIRIRLNDKNLSPEFVCQFLRSPGARQILADGGAGLNIKSLNQGTLSSMAIPVPPARIQLEISRVLREMSSRSDALVQGYMRKLTALTELKQSLLHQAFTGALTAKSADRQLEQVA